MSTTVNPAISYQTRTNLVSPQERFIDQNNISPFLQLNTVDLTPIRLATPTSTSESIKLHDKDGKEIGDVSYDPNDPNSMLRAVNQLAESDWAVDRQEAMKLGFEWQQQMEAEITLAKLMHDAAISALRALRG